MLKKLGEKITIYSLSPIGRLNQGVEGTIIGIDDRDKTSMPYLVQFDIDELTEALDGIRIDYNKATIGISLSLCTQIEKGIDIDNPPYVVWVDEEDIKK